MLEYSSGKVIITIGIMLVYFMVMFFTAFIFKGSKMQEATVEEFAVGSRSFHWTLVLFTYVGTFTTSSLYTSWFSWSAGEGLVSMYIICYSATCYLFMYLMAHKGFIWGKEYKMVVMPDFVQVRYNNRKFTRFFALMALIVEAPWVIMEFYAMGSLVEAITYGKIPHRLATIIIVAFVMAYVLYSGMRAVAWTELVQGILSSMVISVGFLFMAYKLYGGFGDMWSGIYAMMPENLTVTHGGDYNIHYWLSIVTLASIGNLCQLSYFTRLFTAQNPLDIKKCAFVGGFLTLLVCAFQFTIASGGLLVPGAEALLGSELVFFGLADYAFGPWYLGFAAIVVVAAGMSLVSTVMSSHAVTISEIFIKGSKKVRTEAERLRLIRTTLVVYTVIALIIALMNLPNLYAIALGLFEGLLQFVPMMLFGVYWKRANIKGVASGFIFGLLVTYGIYVFAGNSVFGYTGGIIGGLVNCGLIVLFGLLSKPEKRVEELFALAEKDDVDYSSTIELA